MKYFASILFLCLALGFFVTKAHADSLSSASDTISTSRPSASAPLSAGAAAASTQVSIFNNSSRYLASDSAKIIRTSTGMIINDSLAVSSQSSALTTVTFGNTTSTLSHAGIDVLIAPMTAMHTIQFTTSNGIPVNGKIILTFPALAVGDANNPASPSASTFQLNNIGSGQFKAFSGATDITANITFAATDPTAGTAPVITLTLDGVTSISNGVAVKIFLGCSAATSSSCSTQVPRIINPTKALSAGTADRWKILIDTQDGSNNTLDTATTVVGTIESVHISATVDPSLTFTIGGINNGTAVNNGNTTGCTNSETTNTGINATSTEVSLGTLSNTPTSTDTKLGNIAAQLLSVSTNAVGGYVLTATSSSPLRNFAGGFDVASNTTPAAFPASGAHWFGFHPCGLDVAGATWTESGSQNCSTVIAGSTANECRYGWPTTGTPLSLASDSSGPIGNSILAGNGLVSVEYAAGVDASVPAGNYQTVVTYVATPTF